MNLIYVQAVQLQQQLGATQEPSKGQSSRQGGQQTQRAAAAALTQARLQAAALVQAAADLQCTLGSTVGA